MLEDKGRSAATLGYTKFFDRFGADFVMDMLTARGYPIGLANLQRTVYANLIRHIKIAGSYGEPLEATCGMGQGCSLTLIAANATVSVEFNTLADRAPDVETTAFIDDRTLDAAELPTLTRAI